MIGAPIGAAPIGAPADSAPPPVSGTLSDAIAAGEATALAVPISNVYPTDALNAAEIIVAGDVYYALVDALGLSDSVLASIHPALRDAALIIDAATATTHRGATLLDAIRLTEALRLAYSVALTESITVDTVDTVTAYKLAIIAERVLASGLVSGYQQAYAAAISAVSVIALSGAHYFDGALADAIAATDNLLGALLVLSSLADTATFTDTLEPSVRMTAVFSDETTLAETSLASATMSTLLDDAVGVTIALSFGGAEYVGFVLNAANKAASTYTNYPFNSLAKYDDRYFAMADDGLYELVGNTDNGVAITALLRTGLTNFGMQAKKRLPVVYMGAKTDGTLLFSVIVTSETGAKRQYVYTMPAKTAGAVREFRLEPGKGIKSVYWQFELETVDGADLFIDTLALAPMPLDRKV